MFIKTSSGHQIKTLRFHEFIHFSSSRCVHFGGIFTFVISEYLTYDAVSKERKETVNILAFYMHFLSH